MPIHSTLIAALFVIGALSLGFASSADAYAEDAPPVPVFLDGPNMIRVALPEPVTLASLEGAFSVQTKSGPIAVKAVEPGSRPVLARRLPRSPGRVILAGTLQSALGGDAWDPDGDTTQMVETSPGVFELVVVLPAGHYEYKVARNGNWDENYGMGFARGGGNIALEVPADGTIVRFVVDFNARTIKNSIQDAGDTPPPATVPAAPVDLGSAKFDVVVLRLARPIEASEVAAPITLTSTNGAVRPVFARDILSETGYMYAGNDLGSSWTRAATTFKVWSPVAASAEILLFKTASDPTPRVVPMERGEAGVWSARVPGDLHGGYYHYRFQSYGKSRVAADINCFAAGADSTRSMVVDLKRTNPSDWPGKLPPARHSQTDAIVYELHVRDFTALPSSGVRPGWRGKYLGMVEHGTHLPGGAELTGIDYLVDLGITDVHLLPIQNSSAGRPGDYSWGYATTLFNAPEEHYSTTPDDPANVIRETKAMVAGLHRAGIRAVMDVVYNHTWPPDGPDSAFQATVPYYYIRTNDRGDVLNESGVGNAMADERPMVRKYIRDSLLYWLKEYHVDGFRFDLIGMHTPESVKDWAKALRAVNPSVLLYGEPWTGGGPTRFGKGAQKGMRVAVFNDDFRNTIRGELDGPGQGFAMGGGASYDALKRAVTGSLSEKPGDGGFTESPEETINYVSAHDNLTLWDKVKITMPGAGGEEQARAVKLANASVLLSQGIPFLEGGVEIGRGKGGDRNTYNRDDIVNGYHWEHAARYKDVHAYLRGLIALRRQLGALRLPGAGQIKQNMQIWDEAKVPNKTIAYELTGVPGDAWKQVLVLLHGSRDEGSIVLPGGDWDVLVDGEHAGVKPLRTANGNFTLTPLSAFVLAKR